MPRRIVTDDDLPQKPVEPLVYAEEIEDEDEDDLDEIVSAYDDPELVERQDDIDQTTNEYVVMLMGFSDYACTIEDLGYDMETLRQIEDAFEDVLFDQFGITIYRPRVVRDENGNDIIVGSVYDP